MASPEELARETINRLLTDCEWIIQNRSTINLDAALRDSRGLKPSADENQLESTKTKFHKKLNSK
jgi:hypothetical protein